MVKNKVEPKVDLSLVKRLMTELEAAIATAEKMPHEDKMTKNEWIIELSKAQGLALSVMTEASLLVGDIQHLIGGAPALGSLPKLDLLDKLGLKGSGSN